MKKRSKGKNSKNKIWTSVLPLAFLMFFLAVLYGGFCQEKQEIQTDPIQGINAQSSLKGYLGKGYAYGGQDKGNSRGEQDFIQQAQILPEPTVTPQEEKITPSPVPTVTSEDPEEEIQDKTDPTPVQVTDAPTVPDPDSQTNTIVYDPSGEENSTEHEESAPDQNDDRNQDGAQIPVTPAPTETPAPSPVPEEPVNQYPTVATDLTDGETVNASYRTFYVQAKDWYGNSISASALEITGNGQRLSSRGEPSDGIFAYRLDLAEGANTIEIRATDEEGRCTTLPVFTIYKGSEEQQPAGSVTISIEAGTIGLGTILPSTAIGFYQGEQLSSVLLRFLQTQGFDWRNDGDVSGGFYLKAIGRGGIAASAAIPQDLMDHLIAANCQLSEHDANWIGEFDFTMESGWLYFVNGEYMNVGMSAYFPADGDEIRLRFSLYSGADVGAGQTGETWGDW